MEYIQTKEGGGGSHMYLASLIKGWGYTKLEIKIDLLKGTVAVILSGPSITKWYVRFPTVLFKF